MGTARILAVVLAAISLLAIPTIHPSIRLSMASLQTARAANCDRAYPTVCIPSPPPDLDCRDIPHRNFKVLPLTRITLTEIATGWDARRRRERYRLRSNQMKRKPSLATLSTTLLVLHGFLRESLPKDA